MKNYPNTLKRNLLNIPYPKCGKSCPNIRQTHSEISHGTGNCHLKNCAGRYSP